MTEDMKMTALHIGSPARHRATAPFNLHDSLERVRDAYERRQDHLKTVRELSAMTDRDLSDIGIRRVPGLRKGKQAV